MLCPISRMIVVGSSLGPMTLHILVHSPGNYARNRFPLVELALKPIRKLLLPDIWATIAPMGISCLTSRRCNPQGSLLGKIGDSFSPLLP